MNWREAVYPLDYDTGDRECDQYAGVIDPSRCDTEEELECRKCKDEHD